MGFFLVRGAREASSTATWWTLKLLCRFFWSCLRSLITMILRVLEIVFFLYFASHIPITLFIDLQALLPQHVYPQQVSVTYLHNNPPSPHTYMTVLHLCSWKMFSGGTLTSSKTRWWWTRRSGSSPSFSARPWFSCPSSPLQLTPSWKVGESDLSRWLRLSCTGPFKNWTLKLCK